MITIGEGVKPTGKKINAPILGKYFRADYLIDVIYRNGGILPGGAGNIMKPVAFGCGINQEELMMLLTFYGAFMLLAKKDPAEAEGMMVEIGQNLLDNYKFDEEEKIWLKEKFIDKKNKDEVSKVQEKQG